MKFYEVLQSVLYLWCARGDESLAYNEMIKKLDNFAVHM